jgi:hypothetical protein
MQPQQVWEHVQKLHGGLDVLAGVTNAEQGAGLSLLWGPIGKALASMPQADVIADCGRLGADGPLYDLLAEATTVVLVSKVHVADVIRLRDRATAFAAAAQSRGRRNFGVGVVVVADHKKFRASLGEVQHVLGQANAPATVLGGIAHDTKGADLLNGEWGGNLDRTMLIKTAREVARQLVQGLPPIGNPAEPGPAVPALAQPQPEHPQPAHPQPAPRGARLAAGPQPATGPQPVTGPHPGWSSGIPQPVVARYTGPQPAHPALAPAVPTAAQHNQAQRSPADLAAVTLSAPTVSDDAPRTTFSRVRGRPGRHQAEPGQAPNGQLPADQTSSSPARHAHGGNRQEVGDRHGSVFSRPPMAPLSTSDAQAPAGLPDQEDSSEDVGWGTTAWDRQGPAGSIGSRRSGGG